VEQLCARNACRIVHFMAHDRVSFGGSIIATGILYAWLAFRPLRRGEAWAWWTLLFSGICGFLSFPTYLGHSYLDPLHGLATLLLLPIFLLGLILSWRGLIEPKNLTAVCHDIRWVRSLNRENFGRLAVSFSAFGMLSGGLVIAFVGMTSVFVSQDLQFMQTTTAELNALNPKLIPLIAHDRAGFGGGLFSCGVAIAWALWCGVRPGERELWWALFTAGVIGFGTAIVVHTAVGYTDFIHLLPAYSGALAFLLGMFLLYPPLCRRQRNSQGIS
jgi:hypothetical protein